jgi:ketosteroid isomerase-like protein
VSEENVEILRRSYEARNAGDLEAWSEFLASDVVWRVMPDWPEQGPFIGREAVLAQVRQLSDTFKSDTFESIDRIDSGDKIVDRLIWRGLGHGPSMNMEMSCVFTFREGKIIAFEYFWDHADALKAVGLEE